MDHWMVIGREEGAKRVVRGVRRTGRRDSQGYTVNTGEGSEGDLRR